MNALSYKISDSRLSPPEAAQQSAATEERARAEDYAFPRPMVLSSGG